jgi:two-component system, NarL family, sensor histidine kinase DevS
MNEHRLRRLLDVGRSLVSELDPELVLTRVLHVARELTGASYAAIGVLDARRESLERFVTVGIDEDMHRQIGDLPRGYGVLGELIRDPRPLRLRDVGAHARSYGFPVEHPSMTTFLGVPILIEGEAWGNLYLADKAGGEFTADDEEAALVLAGWAAIAIANARLYRTVRERRDELEGAIRGLETTTEISRALGGVTDLGRVLELIVKRSRALLDARVRVLLSGARRRGDPGPAAAAIDDAIEMLGQGIADLRALITDLRPAALDEFGTQAALETLTARVARQSGLSIDISVERDDAPARHTGEIESTIYRLVQEALTNVVKHARARRVQVRVSDTADAVELLIRDDGRGFEIDGKTPGFGLLGMHERVALMHGTLALTSRPGDGTTLHAHIPVPRSAPPQTPPTVVSA